MQTAKNNKVTREQKIDYLLRRQHYWAFEKLDRDTLTQLERDKYQAYIEKDKKELYAFGDTQIDSIYCTELDLEEVKNPYRSSNTLDIQLNATKYNANLMYWAKMDYWKSGEAILLSLGKDPAKLKDDEYINYCYSHKNEPSNLFDEVGKLTKIVNTHHFLQSGAHPSKYIKFFRDKEIAFPQKLGEYVEKYHPEKFDTPKPLISKEPIIKEKGLHQKERDSLEKLVLGLACANYTAASIKQDEVKASEIRSDIMLHAGIDMDDDTIRKYLRASKRHLNLDEQK